MKNALLLLILSSWIFTAKGEEKDSLMQVLSSTRVDTVKANCWNKLSYIFSEEDSAKTRLYATYALQLSTKINFTKGSCEAWRNLAYYHEYFKYDFATAERYYLTGIQIARKEKNVFQEGLGLMDYASVLKKQKKHQKVLQINKKAIEIFTSLRDTVKLIIAYNGLGNAYKNVNQFEKSIKALLKSLQLALLKNDQKLPGPTSTLGCVMTETEISIWH
ncbi:MAG: hypothetical protein WC716_05305 [Chitinophagaceae bacterium]|jgi:tetratricopeptide (TPR) repeat protein